METTTLRATKRDLLGKKVKVLRQKEHIPAVCYGRNFKSLPISINTKEFIKIADEIGEATIIDLDIAGQEPVKVLIRQIQKNPITDDILHVDLYKVDMTQEIQTDIPLEFVGESRAVKDLEGNLITNRDAVKVECLPEKLVSVLQVDISTLNTFEDLIHINELQIPEGIKVLEDPEDVVAQVTPPRSEEELEAMGAETAAETEKAQIEGIEAQTEKEKAKIEGEETSEGETSKQIEQTQKPRKDERKK